jgi:hypothetical protein
MSTFDTYIQLKPASEQVDGYATFIYGFQKHIGIRGFQKLINKFLKTLMTLEGTDLSDRSNGTRFPALIGSNVTSAQDLQDIVSTAVSKAEATLFRYQSMDPSDDPEDILQSAKMTSLVVDDNGAGFEVTILLKNQAGRALQFILPTRSIRR